MDFKGPGHVTVCENGLYMDNVLPYSVKTILVMKSLVF